MRRLVSLPKVSRDEGTKKTMADRSVVKAVRGRGLAARRAHWRGLAQRSIVVDQRVAQEACSPWWPESLSRGITGLFFSIYIYTYTHTPCNETVRIP